MKLRALISLLAGLALLATVTPSVAAYCVATCCEDDPAADTAECCALDPCGVGDEGLAVPDVLKAVPAPALRPAADLPRLPAPPAPRPAPRTAWSAVPPLLATTVLLI